MRKKLYDFSISNAIIVLLAYSCLFIFLLYSILDNKKINWILIIITVLLFISLLFVIWYFVILAVTITDKGIKQGHKFIEKKDIRWKVEYNTRFRYDEIKIYNKYIDYNKLDKKEYNKKIIIVQYFPKYETILKDYLLERK